MFYDGFYFTEHIVDELSFTKKLEGLRQPIYSKNALWPRIRDQKNSLPVLLCNG
jgi:hypothetical protein